MPMLTPKQWFQRVKDPELRKKLLKYLALFPTWNSYEPQGRLNEALYHGIIWWSTPEGFDYWLMVREAWRQHPEAELANLSLAPSGPLRREQIAAIRKALLSARELADIQTCLLEFL